MTMTDTPVATPLTSSETKHGNASEVQMRECLECHDGRNKPCRPAGGQLWLCAEHFAKNREQLVPSSTAPPTTTTTTAAAAESLPFDVIKMMQPAMERLKPLGELLKLCPDALELESRLVLVSPASTQVTGSIPETYFKQILTFMKANASQFDVVPWYEV